MMKQNPNLGYGDKGTWPAGTQDPAEWYDAEDAARESIPTGFAGLMDVLTEYIETNGLGSLPDTMYEAIDSAILIRAPWLLLKGTVNARAHDSTETGIDAVYWMLDHRGFKDFSENDFNQWCSFAWDYLQGLIEVAMDWKVQQIISENNNGLH